MTDCKVTRLETGTKGQVSAAGKRPQRTITGIRTVRHLGRLARGSGFVVMFGSRPTHPHPTQLNMARVQIMSI